MSSSDQPLSRYLERLQTAGIPAEVKAAEDIGATVDATGSVSVDTLAAHLADPEDTPIHHGEVRAAKRYEEVTSAGSLDADFAWFVMGLAYTLIPGLDRSLIEVYQAAGDLTIPVRTHRAEAPILAVRGAAFERNPWAYVVQGIPAEHAGKFRGFVGSYHFQQTAPAEAVWRLGWETLRVKDPLRDDVRGVEVSFALPHNTTTGRRVALVQAPGLMLLPPVFGVVA
jgi:hypothetical protein